MASSATSLTETLELAEQLQAGRDRMHHPQDLPGRFGRVVQAVDRVLAAVGCEAVVGGGWAVWHHGYVGRVTRDLDVALPGDKVEDFLNAAAVAGFEVLSVPAGRWPRLIHKETGVEVDILPEGERPGTPSRPGPTLIRHPAAMGGEKGRLRYCDLQSLIELKLAAGRARDESDVIELLQANWAAVEGLRRHLKTLHHELAARFDELVRRAQEEAQEP